MISTITADQSRALQKAGLSHVCIFNGELRNSKDFSKLPANELERVQHILVKGAKTSHTQAGPTTKAAPAKTSRGGTKTKH